MDGHFNVLFYLKDFCSFSCSRQNVWHGRINSKKTLCVRISSTDQKFLVVFLFVSFWNSDGLNLLQCEGYQFWIEFSLSKKNFVFSHSPGASLFNTFVKGSAFSTSSWLETSSGSWASARWAVSLPRVRSWRVTGGRVLSRSSLFCVSVGYTWAPVHWSKTQEPFLQTHAPCLHNGFFWSYRGPGRTVRLGCIDTVNVSSKLFIQVCFFNGVGYLW